MHRNCGSARAVFILILAIVAKATGASSHGDGDGHRPSEARDNVLPFPRTLLQMEKTKERALPLSNSSNDAPWTFEDCAALLAASPVLQLGKVVHTGLTNMLLQVTDAVAQACVHGAALSFLGMPTSLGNHAPTLDVSEFVNVAELNAGLATQLACQETRLVPRQCLAYTYVDVARSEQAQAVLGGFAIAAVDKKPRSRRRTHVVAQELLFLQAKLGAMFTHGGRLALSDKLMAFVQLRDRVEWEAYDARTGAAMQLRPGEYDAVHLNLDADWIVFRAGKRAMVWQNFFRGSNKHRHEMEVACCDEHKGDPEMLAWVRGVVAEFVKLSEEHFRKDRPVLIATSIGKNEASSVTRWILEEYMAGNPNLIFALGRTNHADVVLNAAAEGRMLERADTFLFATGSTFSRWIKERVQGRGGKPVAVRY